MNIHLLERSSQNPYLNLIKNLWQVLKFAFHKSSPSSLTEFKPLCKENVEKKLQLHRIVVK